MSWIVTASGQELDLRHPQPDSLTIDAIAHSLAQLVRFNGHACRPYSVAEHSLLVCEIVERTLPADVHGLLAALMHDAHESITGDLHTPGKREVGEPWFAFERRHEGYVRTCYALHGATVKHRQTIKQADVIALATERAQLLPAHTRPWEVLEGVPPVNWVDLMEPGRAAMTWIDWRQAFLDKYHELDFARNQLLFPMTAR